MLSLEPGGTPEAVRRAARRPPGSALVRIAAHYFAHGAWLEEGALLRDAGRLAGIPGVLFHGRFDLGGPLCTAWELARAWPGARLHVVEDAGHQGSRRDECRDPQSARRVRRFLTARRHDEAPPPGSG